MIACSHPGRVGDALFCLPTIKALCNKHRCKAVFYTSDWCRPMEGLMRYQPFIEDFVIPPEYVIREHSIGVQPWDMPIDKLKYEAVYQLGFKTYPVTPIPDYIAASEGFEPLPLELFYPDVKKHQGDYLVACSKSFNECAAAFPESPMFFQDMGKILPLKIIGMQRVRPELGEHIDMDLREVASLMAFSKGVLCSPSTPHTIAAFIPRVKMITLKHNWLDERQMWKGDKQLVFCSPRANVQQAREFLGI